MQLTAVERLILLKLTNILELIDPANARQYDADAQALELGDRSGLAELFQVLDLDQPSSAICVGRPTLRLVHSAE